MGLTIKWAANQVLVPRFSICLGKTDLWDSPSPGLPLPWCQEEPEGPENPGQRREVGKDARLLSLVATLVGPGSGDPTCWVWKGESGRMGWSRFLFSWFQFTGGISQTDGLMARPEELAESLSQPGDRSPHPGWAWLTGSGTSGLKHEGFKCEGWDPSLTPAPHLPFRKL